MYVNYPELSALYHHGIKGQKWGVRKEDDQETRLASETNRLKYDEKIAQITNEAQSSIEIARSSNETKIALGKQNLKRALSQDSLLRKESYNERKIKEQKYKTLGAAAIITVLALKAVSKKYIKRVASKK